MSSVRSYGFYVHRCSMVRDWNAALKCDKYRIIMHQSVLKMLMVIVSNFKRKCANLPAVIHKLVIKTGVILQ